MSRDPAPSSPTSHTGPCSVEARRALLDASADHIELVQLVERKAFVPPRGPCARERAKNVAGLHPHARCRPPDHQVEGRGFAPDLGSAGLEERLHLGNYSGMGWLIPCIPGVEE